MIDYERQLKQKILELEKGIDSMKQVNENMQEKTGSIANKLIASSAYANYAKIKVLLELYNKNCYDEEMRELEVRVNKGLKSQEENIRCLNFF